MDPIIISAALSGAVQLIKAISEIRRESQRRGEWTPQQEQAFSAEMEKAFASDAWKVSK